MDVLEGKIDLFEVAEIKLSYSDKDQVKSDNVYSGIRSILNQSRRQFFGKGALMLVFQIVH
ncbi:hypothetical protein SYJ56_03400 [Algoriphagus sp. D3-2-R+10]|uniref:hypothetical protein n=1 Tax=Algoriphagus aurantiacus TaxID=3103948 RepID=UPI002B3B8A6D|nr:hypothetical protein [Algoriphagus sp. D3-2-R+10]MEB2774334.1 hypothetical protein [Algoriphagus sp. D3-2-R+10]